VALANDEFTHALMVAGAQWGREGQHWGDGHTRGEGCEPESPRPPDWRDGKLWHLFTTRVPTDCAASCNRCGVFIQTAHHFTMPPESARLCLRCHDDTRVSDEREQ
jgi:hypothetical protein